METQNNTSNTLIFGGEVVREVKDWEARRDTNWVSLDGQYKTAIPGPISGSLTIEGEPFPELVTAHLNYPVPVSIIAKVIGESGERSIAIMARIRSVNVTYGKSHDLSTTEIIYDEVMSAR